MLPEPRPSGSSGSAESRGPAEPVLPDRCPSGFRVPAGPVPADAAPAGSEAVGPGSAAAGSPTAAASFSAASSWAMPAPARSRAMPPSTFPASRSLVRPLPARSAASSAAVTSGTVREPEGAGAGTAGVPAAGPEAAAAVPGAGKTSPGASNARAWRVSKVTTSAAAAAAPPSGVLEAASCCPSARSVSASARADAREISVGVGSSGGCCSAGTSENPRANTSSAAKPSTAYRKYGGRRRSC